MDNSFIIKLFLNSKDVTEQYSVINAKIYRACNKIDKATISISADIIDNSQFEIPDNKIFNPGTELKFQAGPTDKVNTLFEGCVTTHQLKINSEQQTLFILYLFGQYVLEEMDVERIYLERLRSGSYRDFTKLYESYASRLYAFALHLTHSDALAKDIVQETFIKVWVRREQIDLDMSFSAFLFTMAKNQLLNEFRRQANSPLFLEDVVLNESGDGEETAIERKLSFEEFNHRLEIAKQKLTPRQRELFELNKEQGITITEIAAKAFISEQSVRNQLSQALHVLRKELGKYALLFSLFFIG